MHYHAAAPDKKHEAFNTLPVSMNISFTEGLSGDGG